MITKEKIYPPLVSTLGAADAVAVFLAGVPEQDQRPRFTGLPSTKDTSRRTRSTVAGTRTEDPGT